MLRKILLLIYIITISIACKGEGIFKAESSNGNSDVNIDHDADLDTDINDSTEPFTESLDLSTLTISHDCENQDCYINVNDEEEHHEATLVISAGPNCQQIVDALESAEGIMEALEALDELGEYVIGFADNDSFTYSGEVANSQVQFLSPDELISLINSEDYTPLLSTTISEPTAVLVRYQIQEYTNCILDDVSESLNDCMVNEIEDYACADGDDVDLDNLGSWDTLDLDHFEYWDRIIETLDSFASDD